MVILLGTPVRKRPAYLLAFIATIAAGLLSRAVSSVLPAFVSKYPGDGLWSLMVFFGMGAIFNRASTLRLGFGALGFSFAVEALKLCQAPWLVELRHTTLGHLVLGHVFSWQNLVAYTVGVLGGVALEVLPLVNRVAFEGRRASPERVGTGPTFLMRPEPPTKRLRFGQGMARGCAFFVPIWLVALSFPLTRPWGHVSGILFAASGLLATLPYLRSRVSLFTWWLFGVLLPAAVLMIAAALTRSLTR